MQHPSVDGPPGTVCALDAVGDDNVGVELRIAGAGVPVIERGPDQSFGFDLRGALSSSAGQDRVLLDQTHDVVNCFVMGGDDLFLYAHITRCPQRRYGLAWGEGQVESSNRLLRLLPHHGRADLCDRCMSRRGGEVCW